MYTWFRDANILWVDSFADVTRTYLESVFLSENDSLPSSSSFSFYQKEIFHEKNILMDSADEMLSS